MGVEMQIIGAVAGLMAANKQAQAYKMQAEAYREQAAMADIESDQKEVQRMETLRRQLASLGTAMSSQGVALGTSASHMTLAADEKRIARNDISSIKLMGMTNRRKYELSAQGSEAAGQATKIAAVGSFAKSMYSINNPGTGVG